MIELQLSDMRILMFPRTMAMGGTEKVVLELCRALKDKVGFVGVLSCGGELVGELEAIGVPYFEVSDITAKNPATFRKVVAELKRVVRENDVNLVHCHHRMAALYSRLALPKTVCRVATGHNVFTGGRFATRFLYRGMSIAACGGRVYENLVDYYGLPCSSVTLITNSVPEFDGNGEPIAGLEACPEGCVKIGFVGRLSEQKGAAYLIDAMGLLTSRGVNARCFIVGDGELEGDLRERVKSAGVQDQIAFLGRRDDSQNFLSQVDVCAMPSLWEGLPLVLLEAFSVGTPVVASACDGMLDVIRDGDNGLLVPPGDPVALADAMERLASDSILRERIGRSGRADYEEKFSFDAWTSKYFDFYRKALR